MAQRMKSCQEMVLHHNILDGGGNDRGGDCESQKDFFAKSDETAVHLFSFLAS
jgi:hypothetical protein